MIEKLLSKGKKYDNMGMIEVGGGNMKKSKGFTLIELLAVIVILAIIALIATPIILNIINDSREKSNQRSVEGLKKATETTIGEIMMDSDYTGSDIVCKLGSNISDEVSIEDKKNDETYCWDIGAPEGTSKQVTYSGSRVKAKLIKFNKESGEIEVLGAKVGNSSKIYSTYESNNVLDVISHDLALKTDDSIFIDPRNNVRYRGANPNNYVEFNDESWRMIGIVDGKVKLIRAESIGIYSWDSSAESVNGGRGINEWSQADLMKLLNPGYESETIGGSLYWNRAGDSTTKCYKGQSNITNACDFSSTSKNPGLSDMTKGMIAETEWYLGGHNSNIGITLNNMYEMINYEKGTKVKQNPADGITRTTIWKGYVGLMYPSDYGYAADKNCSQDLRNYNQEDVCKTGNWLYNDGYNEWLLTPFSGNDSSAWVLNSASYVDVGFHGYNALQVRPVLNLKSNVKITGGTGTDTDPYELSM